jgi:hypothetical protein
MMSSTKADRRAINQRASQHMRVNAARRLGPDPDLVGAELERHVAQAERHMARVRRALYRIDSAASGNGPGGMLVVARKAATAAAAADAALDRLSDAARTSLDLEEVLDLLLAARATLDALRESSDLVEMVASLPVPAHSELERWPESLTTAVDVPVPG